MSKKKELKQEQLRKRKKKSSFEVKKIVIYFIIFLFLLAIYFFIGTLGRDEVDEEEVFEPQVTELDFRKDGELDFIANDGSVITTIDIEIADDNDTRMRGLMHREDMEQHQGMLFKFYPEGEPQQVSMWMKNTILPLDMIFIRQDKTISQIETDTVPFDETSIVSDEPVGYVLEVNASFTETYNIEPGQRVEWR